MLSSEDKLEVTVFNVEQGDSFLIHDSDDNGYPALLIDTGSATKKVYKKISNNIRELHVLITHSHSDHINGLPEVIRRFPVTQLYLPFYFPELLYILKILGLKFSNFPVDVLDRIKKTPVTLLCADDYLYSWDNANFKILNPQRNLDVPYGRLRTPRGESLDRVIIRLNELGFNINISDIFDYFPEYFPREEHEAYVIDSREFIKRVFETMSPFIFSATTNNIKSKIRNHLNLISNHISIVLRFFNDTKLKEKTSWLFTGDADKNSFINIMDNDYQSLCNIDVLKVPHHGSNENMDCSLLSIINPKYAIVSHNNRKGNAKDPHPNTEVIEALDCLGIDVFYTNHVKKYNGLLKKSNYDGDFKKLFYFL
nr:MBL fold metallo-hydrolase [Citrobacter freundii]